MMKSKNTSALGSKISEQSKLRGIKTGEKTKFGGVTHRQPMKKQPFKEGRPEKAQKGRKVIKGEKMLKKGDAT